MHQETPNKLGKLTGDYKVTGHGVLVEQLTTQESMGTALTISDKSTPVYYQAYIRQVGPMVKLEEWGFGVGDRILMSGGFVPVPRAKGDENTRMLGIIDPTSIKCVLKEQFIDLR